MKSILATVLATLFIAFVAATPKCPTHQVEDVILLQNPSNCSTFYVCQFGIPYLIACSAGLHFNSELRVCDWPERANCTEFHLRPSIMISESPADLSSESAEESSESVEDSLESSEAPSESTEVPPESTEVPPESTEAPSESTEAPPESTESSI